MKIRFRIDIAFNEEDETYHANVYSVTDHKGAPIKSTSMRKILARVTKLVRDKNSEVKHFPLPEQSLIIAPNQNGDINLIVPAHN